MAETKLFDVVEVEIKWPNNRRVMESALTPEHAADYIKMAIYRRGVETHFYTTQPSNAEG